MFSTLRNFALILFLTWHMFAVAVYAVPRESKHRLAVAIRQVLLPAATPYMLGTSQWQLWNLFSPDPLRRVTYYKIEIQEQGDWQEVETIQPGTYSVVRHATRFKLMSNVFDEFSEPKPPLAGRFLHLYCKEMNIPAYTPVRLVYNYYVIPLHEKRESAAWWNAWVPEAYSHVGYTTTCPSW